MPSLQKKKRRISISAIKVDNIFWPGIDSGMFRLTDTSIAPEIMAHSADVDSVIVTNGAAHHHHLTNFITRYKRFRTFSAGVAFPSMVVVADNIRISRSIVTIGGKFLLNGPSGLRVINRLTRTENPNRVKKFEQIVKAFEEKRAFNKGTLPFAAPEDRNLDLVLVAKNLFNFYHFTRETLPNLVLYKAYNLTGAIIIHSDKPDEGAFVRDQISKFFPELVDRVVISSGDLKRSRALLPLDSRLFYFQTCEDSMPSISSVAKESWMWQDRVLGERNLKTLGMNSCEMSLFGLRKRVLQRVEETRTRQDLPATKSRRLYVERRHGKRLRRVDGEEKLIKVLQALDFEVISFEDHDVLTQARFVAEAEVIVTAHGAGMTNMLYANAGCLCVEISTLQTALLRFGDFNPLALVSQARYLHFFTDHDWHDQNSLPDYRKHGHVGSKLNDTGIAILRSLILAHLNPVEYEKVMSTGNQLNQDDDKSALEDFLRQHFDKAIHNADAHIWAANCTRFRNLQKKTLLHLMQALQLAPRRKPLLRRALLLAKRLDAQQEFENIAFLYFSYHYDTAVELFTQNNWDTAPYAITLSPA